MMIFLLVLLVLLIVLLAFSNLQKKFNAQQQQLHKLTTQLSLLHAKITELTAAAITTVLPSTSPSTECEPDTSPPLLDTVPAMTQGDQALQKVEDVASITSVVAVTAKTQSATRPLTDTLSAPQQTTTSLLSGLLGWLVKGNPVAKIAIIILFFGLAYLLKYSIEHQLLSPEIRILGALGLGIGLLLIGWTLRHKKTLYALILQGGAIGILYLTIFAALKLYTLLPLLLAFTLLLVICACSVLFAILQRAISLAIMASIGGYLAPVLLSTGSGDYIALFSYYLLLSSAILLISFWQSWRVLNLIGFLFTFIVAFWWGRLNFQPDYYLSCQLFILANMIIYGVLAIVLSIRGLRREHYQHLIDVILLFSVPLCGFSLQYAITYNSEFGPAFSALGFGLFYLFGALWTLKKWALVAKQTALQAIAIGLGFATLAIPLALSAQWTALVWLIEGVAITWVMLSQNQYRLAWLGSLITFLGLFSAMYAALQPQNDSTFITLYGITSTLLLLTACLWHTYQPIHFSAQLLKQVFVLLSALCWTIWLFFTVIRLNGADHFMPPLLLCFTCSVWLWYSVGIKRHWPLLCYALLALWPLLFIATIVEFILTPNAAELWRLPHQFWSISWLVSFASAYGYLYLNRTNVIIHDRLPPLLYLSLLWLVWFWLYLQLNNSLAYLPWGLSVIKWTVMSVVAAVIIFVSHYGRRHFPITQHPEQFWLIGLLPVAIYLVIQLLRGLFSSGQIIDWSYIPLLNPLEEGAVAAWIALALWFYHARYWLSQKASLAENDKQLALLSLLLTVGLAFLWGNSLLLRLISQQLGLSWSFYSLWHTNMVQVTFSLTWTLTAVILVCLANRWLSRKLWLAGAILQSVVVIKLILVDSSALEGLLRAFVFIGVALLMLLIGYLAPLPPKQRTTALVNENNTQQDEL